MSGLIPSRGSHRPLRELHKWFPESALGLFGLLYYWQFSGAVIPGKASNVAVGKVRHMVVATVEANCMSQTC